MDFCQGRKRELKKREEMFEKSWMLEARSSKLARLRPVSGLRRIKKLEVGGLM
jgi:hypothetical protein